MEECKRYIDEAVETAADDRRHDQLVDGDTVVHLAVALSLRDLHKQVSKRCPDETPIPSQEWLRLQFWPRRVNAATSSQYGRIKVKYMIPSRQFRHQHVDMHYASALFRYLKEFSVRYRNQTTFVCMDDKHNMKIGEPGYPVAAIERGKEVLVCKGMKLMVGDHDFIKLLLTPSVILNVNILEKVENSFYRGKVFVGQKDHTFEPSSSIRHLTELHSVLKDDTNPLILCSGLKGDAEGMLMAANNSLLAMYTDGGPDHRTNFVSIQLSIISLFLKEDRDMVVAVRTPQYNSWKDPAERVMATLNLGAQAVGLMRTSTEIEDLLKGCNGLKSIRDLDKNNLGLNIKEKILGSTQVCKSLLSSIFERLVYSGDPITSFIPATDKEMNLLWSEITKIDQSLSPSDSTTAAITKKDVFMNFYQTHCKSRHYLFSVKKGSDINCQFHLPTRMDNFETLEHLPDPIPNGEHYEPFENVYGNETSEKHCPSLNEKIKKDKNIPFNPTKQTALNVGVTIMCEECGKSRLLHAEKTVKVRML